MLQGVTNFFKNVDRKHLGQAFLRNVPLVVLTISSGFAFWGRGVPDAAITLLEPWVNLSGSLGWKMIFVGGETALTMSVIQSTFWVARQIRLAKELKIEKESLQLLLTASNDELDRNEIETNQLKAVVEEQKQQNAALKEERANLIATYQNEVLQKNADLEVKEKEIKQLQTKNANLAKGIPSEEAQALSQREQAIDEKEQALRIRETELMRAEAELQAQLQDRESSEEIGSDKDDSSSASQDSMSRPILHRYDQQRTNPVAAPTAPVASTSPRNRLH